LPLDGERATHRWRQHCATQYMNSDTITTPDTVRQPSRMYTATMSGSSLNVASYAEKSEISYLIPLLENKC
jgi:hypothetical protein